MFNAITFAVVILISLLVQSESCKVNGKEYNNGDEWIEKNMFVKKCVIDRDTAWRTEIVGCVSPKGTKMKSGGKVVEGDTEYTCNVIGGSVFIDKHTVQKPKSG